MQRTLWISSKLLLAVFVAVCLLLTGCLNIGKEFPVKPVRQITKGETTQEQIRKMFGNPWRTGLDSGQRTWTYGQYHYGLFGGTTARDLKIQFDDNNVVSFYWFSSTYPEDEGL